MNVQLLNKKEAIFESTLKLINEYGFHGTPMSQIAARANVATGTIYHYFSSKDELILELFKYCRERTNDHIFNVDQALSYKEKFFFIWNRLVDYYIANKEVFWFIEQFYSSPYYELIQQKKNPSYYGADRMRLFFEEGIKSGIIRDVSFYTLVSIYIGTATSHVKMVTYGFCKMQAKGREDILEIIWNGVKNQ
ncbi:TetR family transcriptional regulator [Sphingobacterium allocomposti]|uniref:TetR family transcriptional regulator n=1 Tax=Sphingobacterium allocomposti TaxID=415956 RepID=A0A5S5DPB4_9SPHI|nr:TetR/AcrR family transcriptional regulator [Sphingobacterium composti Yoo et al. 2007 non Ten et al. 2007]TYP97783.1 TetR family transcriptional regulator [Sphingobacterium composti Yoo et al. 2007 non Ten et al. 2007]